MDPQRARLALVLLLIQAGLAVQVALGQYVMVGAEPTARLAGALSLLLALALLLPAAGLAGGWRWARLALATLETALLVPAAITLAFHLYPEGLGALAGGLGLPVALLALALRPPRPRTRS